MSDFSKDTFMSVLPAPLDSDANMHVLADITAESFGTLWQNVSLPTIYARIDSLPESLLDILARDFKVDWYNDEFDLAAKRRLIKNCFYIHKHLGTAKAVKLVLADVWPSFKIEEWFEYGAQPYFFRVIFNIDSDQPIVVDKALRAIAMTKSVRSHLESLVVMHLSVGTAVRTDIAHMYYTSRPCGTPLTALY